jgi:hypothetical protein
MSMLVEACATGRPVSIFDLGQGRYSMRYAASRGSWRGEAPSRVPIAARLRSARFRLTTSLLPARYRRDVHAIHRYLTEAGLASWLGESDGTAPRTVMPDSARIAANAVLRLLGGNLPSTAEPQVRLPSYALRSGRLSYRIK